MNTATADSEETGPDEDTATVTVEAAPGFTVDKGVSTSEAGPFIDEITVQTGTTVFYRITITNTGNVELTGVTLSDNIFASSPGLHVPDDPGRRRPLRLQLLGGRDDRDDHQRRHRRHDRDASG